METWRVANWLQERTHAVLERKRTEVNGEPASSEELPADGPDRPAPPPQHAGELRRDDIVLLILSPRLEYERHLTLADLAQDRRGKSKEAFHEHLVGRIIVVDARLGGLKDGLLNGKAAERVQAADACDGWSKGAGFRVRRATSDDDESEDDDWRFEDDFILRRDGNDDPVEWLVVEHFRNAAQSEDARSISWPQELAAHQTLAECKARRIAEKLGLSDIASEMLAVAALVHDEGKKAPRWQRAFKAPRDARKYGLALPLAKTRGPIKQKLLDHYRHEFGSLAVFDPEHAWAKRLPPDICARIKSLCAQPEWFDLIQHLIAAHHGRARPVIGPDGCEDAPPSALEDRARDVALRFARLQKRWGPWGLAWWESLLRAADQQASRDNEKRVGLDAAQAKEK
jgi:CRISPR-associated endonuclease/helicase Cas3